MRTLRGGWACGCLALALSSCQNAAALSPLEGGATSERELIEAVLDAVAESDGDRMASFLVTRSEYETLLWPEMPDKELTPFEFIWGMTYPRTRKGHRQALDRYGGLDLSFVEVRYERKPEHYPSFTLHKGATVIVRRSDTRETGEIPIFDVLVEHSGIWKLLNYDEL